MPKAVICMAKTQTQAQVIISRLQHAGILADNISIVMSDQSTRYGQPANSESLLTLLKNIGRLVIPGVGFFLAAGPLISEIQKTPQSTHDGLAGALVSLGLPEHEANRYQDMVKSWGILIAFHAPDKDEAQRIREILDNTDSECISVIGEEDLISADHYLRSTSM